jgi:cytochrome P450
MSEAAPIHSAGALKPAHVPDSLVYDFDFFHEPELLKDPSRCILAMLKNAPPIFWTPRNGGHWVLLSYEANFNAARNTELFSSEQVPQEELKKILAQMPPDFPRVPQPFPINLDPPAHSKYRAPLVKAFSPKVINRLSAGIRELAARLIQDVVAKGRCEFMHAVAEPLPVIVFLEMFGLPPERMSEYRTLVKTLLSSIDKGDSETLPLMLQIVDSLRDALQARRDNPQDDLISQLWRTEIDGVPTSQEDMESYSVLLFIAGLDTVVNAMGLGVRHLAQDQALQARLRANPELIPDAVEELLRCHSFVAPRRRIAKDDVFQGVTMKKGEQALLFLPAADLDAEEFPNPEAFDLAREKKSHIVFNAGPHRCVGSHLARIELQTMYEELLTRLPPFRLDPGNPSVFHGGHIIGLGTLHLEWDS